MGKIQAGLVLITTSWKSTASVMFGNVNYHVMKSTALDFQCKCLATGVFTELSNTENQNPVLNYDALWCTMSL